LLNTLAYYNKKSVGHKKFYNIAGKEFGCDRCCSTPKLKLRTKT